MANEIEIRTEEIKEKIEEVFNKAEGEHSRAIVSSAINLIPSVGGALSKLLDEYIPYARQERLKTFLTDLAIDIEKVKETLEHNEEALTEYIKTDEFEFIFTKCLQGATENYQKEKLEAYRAILLNSLIGSGDSPDQKEYFIHTLNSLTTLHINILSFMYKPEEYLTARGIDPKTIVGGYTQIFNTIMPDIHRESIRAAFHELFQQGFINTDKTIFNTTTSSQGLDLIRNRTAPLGDSFIKFITVQ